MPSPIKLELSEEGRATLTMWAKSGKTEQRIAKRSKVILLAAEGGSLNGMAAKVGLSRLSCLKWRKRFAEQGACGTAG